MCIWYMGVGVVYLRQISNFKEMFDQNNTLLGALGYVK